MDILCNVILIIILPLVVTATAYLTIKTTCEKELKKQAMDLNYHSKQLINPVRLQAYERLALLLERMKPESLLLRNSSNNLSAGQYRTILLTTIRSEFEHNLSQQVYVSDLLWVATKNAKDDISKMINLSAGKTGMDAQGADLATAILDIYLKTEPSSADVALGLLRKEIKELY
jgi:hypothetical protein